MGGPKDPLVAPEARKIESLFIGDTVTPVCYSGLACGQRKACQESGALGPYQQPYPGKDTFYDDRRFLQSTHS